MNNPSQNFPRVVSRDEWVQARLRLLAQEKEHTRAADRLNAARRELPMVKVDRDYVFEGPKGKVRLLDVFEGRPQLIVYHFMWLWEKGEPLDEGCRGCSGWADEIARGHVAHLQQRNTTLAFISRGPYAKLAPFQQRMGWKMRFYSSFGSSFNFDFHASFDEKIAPIVYNYRTPAEHTQAGTGYYFEGREQPYDLHAISCFFHRGDEVFHTYSNYGRGAEMAGGSAHLMDLTLLGRQEDWEEPKGRAKLDGVPQRPDQIPYPDQN